MGRRGRTRLIEEEFFFVTTTVVHHARVFAEQKCCDILIGQLKSWQQQFQYAILGYVIMPSHFHWIVRVNPSKGTISDVMREIKAHAAWNITEELERSCASPFSPLFARAAKGVGDQRRQFWIKRFDDQVIRSQRMFMAKLAYIHTNPVKAGLVERAEQFKYSSARNYICGNHSVIHVDTSYAG